MGENKRALLFNVKEPLEMSIAEFDDLWPSVSNVWVQWSQNTLANGDSWKVWSCRFAKHCKSSTRQEGIIDSKRRKTMVRQPGLCNMKIKVTRVVATQKVCTVKPEITHTVITHNL
jgi:2,5-diamino-6-(ribosylamino)-4(3H)-pyrimidinone 5'-phosphate reductase